MIYSNKMVNKITINSKMDIANYKMGNNNKIKGIMEIEDCNK